MRRLPAVAVALGLCLVASGCSSGSAPFPSSTLPSGSAAPAPTAVPTPAGSAPAAPDCGNPVQSFAPAGDLPAPGKMPDGTAMAAIRARGRLVVGVSADTLLFGSRNPISGRIEGFDIDMLRAVAQAIFGDPDKIEYRVITYAQRLPSLQKGTVDLVAHTMTINCTRWQQISFSAEYFHAGQKVLVRSDSTVAGIQDLAGRRVCAATGSTNLDNLAAYPDVKPVAVDDLTDCMVAFQQGSVDAVTADDTVLAGFAAQDPYAKVVGKPFTDEPYGIGVAKTHPELVRFVNAVLDQVKADGRWKASYDRWMAPVTAPRDRLTTPPASLYGRQP
jgi:polar amino acid transport system substrate-binding protein